jgi:hypothetical protein
MARGPRRNRGGKISTRSKSTQSRSFLTPRFEEFVTKLTKGKDAGKVRIILE